jgi:hypothetical protein
MTLLGVGFWRAYRKLRKGLFAVCTRSALRNSRSSAWVRRAPRNEEFALAHCDAMVKKPAFLWRLKGRYFNLRSLRSGRCSLRKNQTQFLQSAKMKAAVIHSSLSQVVDVPSGKHPLQAWHPSCKGADQWRRSCKVRREGRQRQNTSTGQHL